MKVKKLLGKKWNDSAYHKWTALSSGGGSDITQHRANQLHGHVEALWCYKRNVKNRLPNEAIFKLTK
jgi:hypothetical protein